MARWRDKPTKEEIRQIVRTLKPGQRKSLGRGSGISVTKDRAGRVRFQWRSRMGGRGSHQACGTCDTFAEAVAERDEFLERKKTGTWRRVQLGMTMLLTVYVNKVYRLDLEIERTTMRDYLSTYRRLIKPYFKGMTLGQILLMDDFDPYIKWVKKHADGPTAVQKALNLFLRLLNHAVAEKYIADNPYQRNHDKRRASLKKRSARKPRRTAKSSRPRFPICVERRSRRCLSLR